MTTKTAQHPNGSDSIQFREQYHQYIDNYGSRYVSGTSFFKPYIPKFDAPAVAEKCSKGPNPKYSGRGPQDIIEEWATEGKRGTDEGDNVHMYAEHWPVTNGNPDIQPISDRCAALFKQVDAAFFDLILNRGYQIIASEMIVFSPDLLIAGTIDLLLMDPAINHIIITDWKQNKSKLTTTNNFKKLLPPIEHLQYTEINKYSLQLSIYEYILKREGYFPSVTNYTRQIIHLFPQQFEYINLDYYEYEIREILNNANRRNLNTIGRYLGPGDI